MQTTTLTLHQCPVGCLRPPQRQHLRHGASTDRLRRVPAQPGPMRVAVTCNAGKAQQQEGWDQVAEVSGGPPPQRPFTETWIFKGAAVGVLLALAAAILGRVRRRSSMSDLEDRGYLDESRGNADPYLEDIMKNVNKVQYEELTEKQIADARKRRARGLVDFREAEPDVPKDHPFATKQELTPDEEKLIEQRLSVRRGLPVQDLGGRRGFPGSEPA